MDSDDLPVGRLLSRRAALALLGASTAALAAGAALLPRRRAQAAAFPGCIARPQQTEGPYFVDARLARSDIRADTESGRVSAGTPLALAFVVSRIADGGCEPLPGAQVDLWHCDARGVYSGVSDPGFDTVGQTFLRGHQLTGATGRASFRTIYPGWYPSRAVHVHFKVRVPATSGRAAEFTSQLYFDDALTDRVHAAGPYSVAAGARLRNEDDRIYRRDGDQLLLELTPDGDGFSGTFTLGLQLD